MLFLALLVQVINLIVIVVFVAVAARLLAQFGVLNLRNRWARLVVDTLDRLVEPMLEPIRRVVPIVGGFDLSPLILILGLQFLGQLLIATFAR